MIYESKIQFLDETWRPAAAGGRGRGGGAKPVIDAAAKLLAGSHRGQSVRAKLARVTSRAPEVMVKVTGRQRGASHTLAHLDYISRHGKLEVETGDGERLETKAAIAGLAEEWVDHEHRTSRRREPLTSVSMILSMPPGHDPNRIYEAARAFARVELERFPYAMALHTDTDHPHVHLTVAAKGEGGARFNPRKDDLARWREAFARELRARGIEAEATPRRARGQTQKYEKTAIRKIRDRAASGAGAQPSVAAGVRRDAETLAREAQVKPQAWETRLVARQAGVRADYNRAADLLAASDDPADRALAVQTRRFVADMPTPMTKTREAALKITRQQAADRSKPRSEPPRPPRSRDKDSER